MATDSVLIGTTEYYISDIQEVVLGSLSTQIEDLSEGKDRITITMRDLERMAADYVANNDDLEAFHRLGFDYEEDRSVNFFQVTEIPEDFIGTFEFTVLVDAKLGDVVTSFAKVS